MRQLTRYTFYPNSIKGLQECIELEAQSYREARNRALKYMFLQQTAKHPERGEPSNEWELES